MFLKVRYSKLHYIGIVLCMLGAPLLIFNDWLTHSDSAPPTNSTISPSNVPTPQLHQSPTLVLIGDLIALAAASCYAASNLCCEHMTKLHSSSSPPYERQQDEPETSTTTINSREAKTSHVGVSPFAYVGLLGLFGMPLSAVQL